jgi:outer membrane immunogenic protein
MKRIVLGLFSVSALVLSASWGSAQAADMAVKAPPPPPPPAWSWTGWYLGVNAGATLNDSSYNLDPAGCFIIGAGCGTGGLAGNPARTFANSFRSDAFTAGVQVGYNYQAASNWVWGIEADFNFNGNNDTDTVSQALGPPIFAPGAFVHTVTDRLDWFGTIRPRAGFLVMPNLLVYGTGGFAYGNVSSVTNGTFPPPGAGDTYVNNTSTLRAGWVAGGGLEWAMMSGWSVKAEYLHIDLGSFSYTDACPTVGVCTGAAPPPAYQTTIRTHENVARIGVNWKINPNILH